MFVCVYIHMGVARPPRPPQLQTFVAGLWLAPCSKPLPRASVYSTAVFNRFVTRRVCRCCLVSVRAAQFIAGLRLRYPDLSQVLSSRYAPQNGRCFHMISWFFVSLLSFSWGMLWVQNAMDVDVVVARSRLHGSYHPGYIPEALGRRSA